MNDLREKMRAMPAGQLLWSMGMDYYDTETSARRVAEKAAEEIARLKAELLTINNIIFAKGAPLGSNEYFGIREIASKYL